MNARTKLMASGVAAVSMAVGLMLILAALYWPFQVVVQVVLPFILIGTLIALGLATILTAHFLPVEMFEAPLTGAPRWADWLSVAAVGFAALGLLVAVTLPGPMNPALSNPAFVSGYGVVTGCTASPPATAFEIHYVNSGAVDATGVTARYILYALNSTTQSYGASVAIGTVPARTSGAVSVTAPLGCSAYGSSVTVTFTWS